jgi:hypothetical protein
LKSKPRDEVKLLGATLAPGDSTETSCPFCGTEEKKLSITRIEQGLLYNCFRASCPARGFIPSNPSSIVPPQPKTLNKIKPYYGEISSLPGYIEDWLHSKYWLDKHTLKHNNVGWNELSKRVVIPVTNKHRFRLGHMTRSTKWSPQVKRKAIYYPEVQTAVHLYYPAGTRLSGNGVYLVEDCYSAIRLNQIGRAAVALLGVNINLATIRELQNFRKKFITLDPDAEDLADMYKKEFSLYGNFSVIKLSKDAKDLSPEQLTAEVLRGVKTNTSST